MGFGEKFKDLRQQAQEKVAENREKIQGAIDAAGVAANAKTHGKHAGRIMNVSQRAGAALDKFGAGAAGAGDDAAAPVAGQQQDTIAADGPRFADADPPATPTATDGPRFADEHEPVTAAGSPAGATSQPASGWAATGEGPKFDDEQ